MNKRDEVIEEAQSLINGDRLDVYGDPVKNFETIAHLWKPIFGEVTAQQVGLALLQLKVARATTAPDHIDSYVDMIGYAALTAEVQSKASQTYDYSITADNITAYTVDIPANKITVDEVPWHKITTYQPPLFEMETADDRDQEH